MLKCWTDVPSDRPTFSEITEEIKQFTSTEESSDVSQPLQSKIEPGGSQEYLGVMGWGPVGGQRIERTWIDRGYRCRGNEGSACVWDQWSVTQSTCRSSVSTNAADWDTFKLNCLHDSFVIFFSISHSLQLFSIMIDALLFLAFS